MKPFDSGGAAGSDVGYSGAGGFGSGGTNFTVFAWTGSTSSSAGGASTYRLVCVATVLRRTSLMAGSARSNTARVGVGTDSVAVSWHHTGAESSAPNKINTRVMSRRLFARPVPDKEKL